MSTIRTLLLVLLCYLVYSQNSYSTKTAKHLTELAAISYESEQSILNWNCNLCGIVPFQEPQIFKNDSNSVFGFVGYSPQLQKIVVAFRGSVDIANWVLNLKTVRTSYPLCSGCSVHIGFNQGFNSVRDKVQYSVQYFRNKYPLASLIITGHSLGGALAVLAAAHLHHKYQLVQALYTQGQPRVGNDNFGQFMTSFVPNTFRIVHYADQIPHVPQSILGFKHGGWQIWYQEDMQRFSICPSQSKQCSNQFTILKLNQADHKMLEYLKLKADNSLLSEVLNEIRFRWTSWLSRGHLFNLDMQTMLEQDRQVKEALAGLLQQNIAIQ